MGHLVCMGYLISYLLHTVTRTVVYVWYFLGTCNTYRKANHG